MIICVHTSFEHFISDWKSLCSFINQFINIYHVLYIYICIMYIYIYVEHGSLSSLMRFPRSGGRDEGNMILKPVEVGDKRDGFLSPYTNQFNMRYWWCIHVSDQMFVEGCWRQEIQNSTGWSINLYIHDFNHDWSFKPTPARTMWTQIFAHVHLEYISNIADIANQFFDCMVLYHNP